MASEWKIAAAILLPFRRTFRRLELEKRWWHRLCLVTFFAVVPTIFAAVAGLSYSTLAPKTSSEPEIWRTDTRPLTAVPDKWDQYATPAEDAPPSGQTGPYTIPIPPDAHIGSAIIPGEKVVYMPDGKAINFPGSMSDDAIKAQLANARHQQMLAAILWASLIAILSTLVFSYLFQCVYRTLLYIVFGNRTMAESSSATA